jgi:hypothetical protein
MLEIYIFLLLDATSPIGSKKKKKKRKSLGACRECCGSASTARDNGVLGSHFLSRGSIFLYHFDYL